MSMTNYRYRGDSINYVNDTEKDIAYGDIVSLRTRVGIAGTNIPAGATGSLHTVGVFEMPKAATVVIEQGAAVYFNTENGYVTTTDTDVPCGWAIASATADDTFVAVKIG